MKLNHAQKTLLHSYMMYPEIYNDLLCVIKQVLFVSGNGLSWTTDGKLVEISTVKIVDTLSNDPTEWECYGNLANRLNESGDFETNVRILKAKYAAENPKSFFESLDSSQLARKALVDYYWTNFSNNSIIMQAPKNACAGWNKLIVEVIIAYRTAKHYYKNSHTLNSLSTEYLTKFDSNIALLECVKARVLSSKNKEALFNIMDETVAKTERTHITALLRRFIVSTFVNTYESKGEFPETIEWNDETYTQEQCLSMLDKHERSLLESLAV